MILLSDSRSNGEARKPRLGDVETPDVTPPEARGYRRGIPNTNGVSDMERGRLVVTRKDGQSLWIGDSRVNVSVKGKTVKLTIEADKRLHIVREELRTRKA